MYKVIHIDGNKLNNNVKNLKKVLNDVANPTGKQRRLIATNLKTGRETNYDSMYEASQDLNINPGAISLIAEGKRKTVRSKYLIKNTPLDAPIQQISM